jgi:hypothetical protein
LALLGPLVVDFIVSLDVATGLAADDLGRVNAAAEGFAPVNADAWRNWSQRVEKPALKLADPKSGSIGLLSSGWGRGLEVLYVMFWLGLAPACFLGTAIYYSTRSGWDRPDLVFKAPFLTALLGTFSVIFAMLPLYFSFGVARVSTACQYLLDQLNTVRIRDPGQHNRVLALETALVNANRRQGLGIVGGFTGVVVDVRLLKQIALILLPAISTAGPILWSSVDAIAISIGQNNTVGGGG